MQVVFIRHGHYGGSQYKTKKARDEAEMSDYGVETVEATGWYLAEHGILPDVVLYTGTQRTEQTARIVKAECGRKDVPSHDIGSAFRDMDGFVHKFPRWLEEFGIGEDKVLFIVGHGPNQGVLRNCWPKKERPPSHKASHGAALVLEVTPGQIPVGNGFYVGWRKPEKSR